MIGLAIWKGYCVGFCLFMAANLFMMRFDKSKDEQRKKLFGELQREVEKMGYGERTVAVVLAVSLVIYSAFWFWYIPKMLLTKRKKSA